MKLGCRGIILKHTEPDLIVKSIRKVNAGEIWLDSYTTAAVMQQSLPAWILRAAAERAGATVIRFPRASGKS